VPAAPSGSTRVDEPADDVVDSAGEVDADVDELSSDD
jgi:hypothetical protein